MPINLTTPQTISNGTRLVINQKRWDEDDQIIRFQVSMRTGPVASPPDCVLSAALGEIRGPSVSAPSGSGTVIGRATLTAGQALSGLLQYGPARTVSQAQFDAAVTALKANAATFEAHLLSAGYLDASLAGT